MHTYIVGQFYDPSRKSWPEGADYNFRAGGTNEDLPRRATPREIAAVGTGRVDFGLMAELPETFVVSRFRGPDGRVVCSFDCSYSWHRVSPDERTDPPVWEDTSPHSGRWPRSSWSKRRTA